MFPMLGERALQVGVSQHRGGKKEEQRKSSMCDKVTKGIVRENASMVLLDKDAQV